MRINKLAGPFFMKCVAMKGLVLPNEESGIPFRFSQICKFAILSNEETNSDRNCENDFYMICCLSKFSFLNLMCHKKNFEPVTFAF